MAGSDTVYLSAVDGEGNACSFINSLYMGTGSGLVVPGTGVSLQNRRSSFSIPNTQRARPNKRPYHTIIPAMTTRRRNCTPATASWADIRSRKAISRCSST